MHTFNSDGISIAYLDQGGGAPGTTPVLLIHGFASNTAMNWRATGWVEDLSSWGHRVIALDNRGHGQSEKLYDTAFYPAPLMAEDARRLLDHLGIERAHVVGYSMGARISAFLAMAHPERVRSVVFGGLGINMVRGLQGTPQIAEGLDAASLSELTDPMARTFRLFAEQTKSDLRALSACIRSSRQPITAEAISALSCPVLVAVGEKDQVSGSGEELAALIPGAQSFVIPGREHMKAVGDKAFKTAVRDFIAAHE